MMKIGCCGFPVSKEKYFKNFSVVEIQQTFYKLPRIEIVKKWKEMAPSGFHFCLKANQAITHPISSPTWHRSGLKENELKKLEDKVGFFKPTKEVFEGWERTEEIIEVLNAKIVIFQCPASFKPEKENLKNIKTFFKKIKRRDYVFCWEPRGDWDKELIKNLCKELDLVHCTDPFKSEQVFGKIRYFRLHGIKGYNYKYSDEDLNSLKKFITKPETYFMFNNVYMFEDALRFKKLCQKENLEII